MSIIFGGDAGIQESSFSGFIDEMMGSFNHIKDTITNAIEGKGPPQPSKENVHVDTGFANVPGTSFKDSDIENVDDIKQRRITSQEPSMTIYIKKRAFWGLSDQNDSRFMDSGEKLFMRASKILFEKKCGQIASYEALTKLSSLVSEDAHLDAAQIELVRELIIEAIQAINSESTGLINKAIDEGNSSFADELRVAAADLREEGHDLAEALRELSTKSHKLRQATNTSWVIDPDQKDVFGVGRGSGVIELTLVSSANTSLDIEGSDGSFNFTVQDPYNLTKITSDDIEISLSSAIAEKARLEYATADEKNYELVGASTLLDRAKRKEEELRRIRQDRIADAFGFDRQALGGGGVAEIVFEINATSSAANPVVAYTTSTDVPPFNKDSFRIAMLQLPVEEMLTFKEDALVGQIFDLLEDYVHAVKNLNVAVKEGDDAPDTKYARRMLRMHYLGKAIAQPMDSVHIYMRGNTVKHNELIGPLSSILNGTSFFSNVDDNQNVSDAILNAEMEEFGLTDLKIPLDFYKSIRTGSFMRNAGMHVFGGVISSVSESYNASSGSYTLEVSGESNLKWLNLSRVNTQPSLDQPKGMLEDPLTPLELETEPGTGLLKKNPGYLQANKDRINKWGLFNRDEKVNEEDDLKKYDSVSIGDKSQVIMKHAPGLVYKWKQGVIVASLNVNLATSLSGKGDDINNVKRFMGLNVVDQPFAGQDAADIVSLLVTGFPHSADRFINNSKESGTYSSPGSNSSGSFFHSFFDITRSTNKALGNFKPFKHIETGLALHARRIKLQESLKGGYSKIDDLRSQIAVMEDQLLLIEKENNTTSGEPSNIEKGRLLASTGLGYALGELRDELYDEVGELKKRAKQAETDNLIGPGTADGIAFRLDEIPGGIENDAQEENMKSIMLKNKLLQLRPQYNCKFNTDSNMFIVSDKYDNDNDIQAFVTNLKKSQNLFQSEYQNPVEICREVTKTIDFEFYCMSGDTIILTMDEFGNIGSKRIENFADGDRVLSIDQKTQIVDWKPAKLLKRRLGSKENMFAVRDGNGNTLNLSDNHKLLDYELNEIYVSQLTPDSKLGTANSLPNIEEDIYLDIDKLFVEHKWYTSHDDKFKIGGQGSKCKLIPKKIKLDEDLSWLFGIYVAEGSVSDPTNRVDKNSRGYHTQFSLNYNEYAIAERISKIISEKLNISSKIYRYEKYGRCSVDVGSFVFSKIIKHIFGRTLSSSKKIPSIMWRARNKNKLAFISGIIIGDGTYNRRISVSSISKYLLNDISQILLMMGICSKIDKYNKIHIYGKENIDIISYYLHDWKYYNRIKKYCSSKSAFRNRKMVDKTKVKDIKKINYDGFVYDLEVDDYHTFLLGSTWSHNCDTQGHIRFRPPQYNRVPLSLVLKMFLLKKGGTQIYPDFLVSLFKSRLGTVQEEIQNLKSQIDITALLLGLTKESDAVIQEVNENVFEEEGIETLFFRVGDGEAISEKNALSAAEKIVEIRSKIKGSTGRMSYLSNIDNALEQVKAHNDPKQFQINSIRLTTFNNLKALVARYQQVASLESKLKLQDSAYEVSKKDFSKENISKLLAPFSDLIEDDFNDFLGPGSSKRFIIYDDQIISYNFTESDQNAVCRVDVNGELDLLGEGPGNLGGMPAIWAGATDFDMWRMYGYRSNGAFRKPFLTKAEEQCAPYALFLMARARRDIVKANLTVYGNEYYQVGDVVYINSRDMLYYVWGVKQNFSYEGGQFTTSLDLRYGHALGEYIPTPLDVIGKSIIRTQEKFNRIVVTRETANPYEGVHLGMVIFEEEKTEDDFKAMLTEPHARFNVDQLKRSLLIARVYIEENKLESFPKVEVRGWYFEKEGEDKGEVKAKMQKRIDHVVDWLKHPRGRWIENEDRPIKLAQQFDDSKLQEYEITNIIKDANITPVNLAVVLEGDDKKRNRTPNDQVYNATPDGDPNNIIELVLIMED